MKDWIHIEADPVHISRERAKARKLKRSNWWKNKIYSGICYYCGRRFKPSELTMDHKIPLSRGGRSTKDNIVPSCKECNNKKKYLTPVDMIIEDLKSEKSPK
ncbi:MAG: HNH endonuclease [Nitrospirae bacterium]|nr:MAG: HNH endonuclease [Nitrospirota bacterium]